MQLPTSKKKKQKNKKDKRLPFGEKQAEGQGGEKG
jgi:hypothetical protein